MPPCLVFVEEDVECIFNYIDCLYTQTFFSIIQNYCYSFNSSYTVFEEGHPLEIRYRKYTVQMKGKIVFLVFNYILNKNIALQQFLRYRLFKSDLKIMIICQASYEQLR